jgi:hypothetical protein
MNNDFVIPEYQLIKATNLVFFGGIRKATAYISPIQVMKITFRGKRDNRSSQDTALITIGRPNYAERKFIKSLKKSGEPFPIKRIQLKEDMKKR